MDRDLTGPTLSVLRKKADGEWVIFRDVNIVGSERQPVDG
jgi:ketosteroid isomerase-like protein